MKYVLASLGMICIFAVHHWYEAKQREAMTQLELQGVPSAGAITHKDTRSVRRGKEYHVDFSYLANNGMWKASKEVSLSFYNQHDVGSAIPVRYLPSDPKTVMIEGQSFSSGFAYYLSMVLLTASVLFLIYALFDWIRGIVRPESLNVSSNDLA